MLVRHKVVELVFVVEADGCDVEELDVVGEGDPEAAVVFFLKAQKKSKSSSSKKYPKRHTKYFPMMPNQSWMSLSEVKRQLWYTLVAPFTSQMITNPGHFNKISC